MNTAFAMHVKKKKKQLFFMTILKKKKAYKYIH